MNPQSFDLDSIQSGLTTFTTKEDERQRKASANQNFYSLHIKKQMEAEAGVSGGGGGISGVAEVVLGPPVLRWSSTHHVSPLLPRSLRLTCGATRGLRSVLLSQSSKIENRQKKQCTSLCSVSHCHWMSNKLALSSPQGASVSSPVLQPVAQTTLTEISTNIFFWFKKKNENKETASWRWLRCFTDRKLETGTCWWFGGHFFFFFF